MINDDCTTQEHDIAYIMLDINFDLLELYNQMIDENPNNWMAWYGKGGALYNLNHLEAAAECFDRARALGPPSPYYGRVKFNEGNTFARLGRFKQAIQCYDRALQLDSDYYPASHNRAVALYFSSQWKAAAGALFDAIKLRSRLSGKSGAE